MIIKDQASNEEIECLHAKTIGELTKGLMFKKSGNMLLEFPIARRHGIWMMFMQYPLDLIFIDREKTVTEIKKNIPPLTLNPKTWKTYYPKTKSKYVLEIDAREKHKIQEGNKLNF